jgi:hypothetical protein
MKLYKPTLFDSLVFALLVYLAFSAFSHGQGLPKGALGLSGTVYAPAGQDIFGTFVVACYAQGEDCDEAKSQYVEITASGASASFDFTNLGRENYMLFATKDVNANGTHFEDGDFYAVYGMDGTITPPAPGLELSLEILGAAPPTPTAVEGNTVTGVVLDSQGQPLANVEVWIEPALKGGMYSTTGLYDTSTGLYQTRTDATGRYTTTALPTVPYYAKAWTRVQYDGQEFCLRLGMPNPGDYDSFVPEVNTVRNFQWQLSGVIEDLRDLPDHFGGEIRLYTEGNMKDGLVELTFTPTAPLVDGSMGQTITRTLNVNEEYMVYDIPLGLYNVSGVLLENDGSRTLLHVGRESYYSYQESIWDIYQKQTEMAALEFKPIGCSNSSGIDRAFLYLNSPHDFY